ncbi:hypothetical protein [Paraburkholderia sp. J8-2]|uniref:hypothetical protein n=1 Tax=Paraburkholderia sp. J8-2 TaxID=2805440 RepID=UPI002AB628A7|nr:hypothetical protein [Paraburkholderia sp. J8-2]
MNLNLFGEAVLAPPAKLPALLSDPLPPVRVVAVERSALPVMEICQHEADEGDTPAAVTRAADVGGSWAILMKDARRRAHADGGMNESAATRRAREEEERAVRDDSSDRVDPAAFDALLCQIDDGDDAELVMCKLLANLMWNDLRAIVKRRNFVENANADLFGFEKSDRDEVRLYGALQWIYGLQDARAPEPIDGGSIVDVMVTFEFVCHRLGWGAERIRRVVARCVREHFAPMLRAIEALCDAGFVLKCERKLEEYVDVTNWRKS